MKKGARVCVTSDFLAGDNPVMLQQGDVGVIERVDDGGNPYIKFNIAGGRWLYTEDFGRIAVGFDDQDEVPVGLFKPRWHLHVDYTVEVVAGSDYPSL